jgi:Zn-dependent peptidase ImmA (M78 family)/transcriptional regulator with XRE-family HTH domain
VKGIPGKAVPITGQVLEWAREESGLTQGAFAALMKVDEGTIAAWEAGTALPTKGQFSRIVGALERPSAIFFLPEAPIRAGLPTSFRSAPGLAGHQLGQGEVGEIRWARRLQDIASWLLSDGGAEPAVLPSERGAPHADAAARFRGAVGITASDQLSWKNPADAFRVWRAGLEDLGVIVLQLQMGKDSIRGFSAWDRWAPMVAVNTAYHPTARIFTLFHEIGHLLTRTDAACLRFVLPTHAETGVERWCERFAAAFLLPEDDLRTIASSYGVDESRPVVHVDVARRIANRFKVSVRAASLRLQELGLAPPTLYRAVEQAFSASDWNSPSSGGGGLAAAERRLGQLGVRVPELLLAGESSGRLTRRDVADYLRLTTGQLEDLSRLVAAGA